MSALSSNSFPCFNSRARMGRDERVIFASWPGEVSIHAPAWGATVIRPHVVGLDHVSIHAPAWGATIFWNSSSAIKQFQFTRPHGARQEQANRCLLSEVSIHAPAWGATCTSRAYTTATMSFNSRARMGRDTKHRSKWFPNLVSIHAPAWGATRACIVLRRCRRSFNSRARMGRDSVMRMARRRKRFQFTRPHGARLGAACGTY